jgi:phenylalanyl-tRNA synthetase, beta subunit
VRRDLAFVMPETTTFEQLQAALRGVQSDLIQEITLFDVYRGAGLPENHKSMALKVILQSTEDTLTDEVVEPIVAELVAAAEGIGARLRA